jgi:alkanesulfonate monooxygenase SsuD/methylene tetrahydromethanopterin reductase-like flavin-dependent oxidoreductase (luciferase family)
VAVAEQAVLVDLLSGGRCVLGVGVGWRPEDFAGFGLPFDRRFTAFADGLKMLRALLSGETVSYEGALYACEEARLRLLPVRDGGPPIWVGATGPQGIRRAARLADAWILSPQVRVPELQEGRAIFEEARAEAGLPPATDVPLRREAFVAETDDEAWRRFADGIRHQYGHVYASRHPDFPVNGSMRELQAWARDLAVVGSVETVTAEFEALGERLGATEILVRPRLPGVDPARVRASIELLGEVVARLDARAQAVAR